MKTYQIEVSERQLEIIRDALEFLSRVHSGQLDTVYQELYRATRETKRTISVEVWQQLRELLDTASQRYTGMGYGASFGIFDDGASETSKIAWDLYRDIRYRLAWDQHPEGGYQVIFDNPSTLRASQEEIAKVVEKKVDK